MAITDYPITSGWHEIDRVHSSSHSGCDYALPQNTPLEAILDGIVIGVSTNDILGNNIRFKTPDGKIIVYGHLSQFKVKEGDYIHKNQVIGLSGGMPNTVGGGRSTGPHLHLSVYGSDGILVDPAPFVINQAQYNNSSPFLFPVMIIILFIIFWKLKKYIFYGIAILLLLGVIFISS